MKLLLTPSSRQAATEPSVASNVAFLMRSLLEFDKALVVFGVVNALASAAVQVVPALMSRYVIDALVTRAHPAVVIGTVLSFALVMFCSQSLSSTTNTSIGNRLIVVRLRFMARIGARFMRMDYQALETPETLDLSQRAARACDNPHRGVGGMASRLLALSGRLIVLVGAGAIVFTLNPAVLLLIGCVAAWNFGVANSARAFFKRVNERLAPVRRKVEYVSHVMGDFSFGKDVRLSNMSEFLLGKLTLEQGTLLDGERGVEKRAFRSKGVYGVAGFIQEGVIYAWLCWLALRNAITIGDFVMYAAATRALSQAVGALLEDVARIRVESDAVSDLRLFLSEEVAGLETPEYPVVDTDVADRRPGVFGLQEVPKDVPALELDGVWFRYPGREDYALRDVSLSVGRAERLAVVGVNGAGKSTLIKLLIGLYHPQRGRVSVDGVDVRAIEKTAHWARYSVVFQDFRPFAFTIAENVSMRPLQDTDIDRVVDLLETVGLGERMAALPLGVKTPMLPVLEGGGVQLSGGELQKLALARALYKGADTIVLDEPTAALDPFSEELLYQEFGRLLNGRTTIYVTHRLASTRFCDRIIVLEDGRLVESGSHTQLIALGGRYARMFETQANLYREQEQ